MPLPARPCPALSEASFSACVDLIADVKTLSEDLCQTLPSSITVFISVTDKPGRQYMLIALHWMQRLFFQGLAGAMSDGLPEPVALNDFGRMWGVEFLGPPLKPSDMPTCCLANFVVAYLFHTPVHTASLFESDGECRCSHQKNNGRTP
jgi:hypothetical protein